MCSISSDDSIFGDDNQVITEREEEIDCYAILNVPRNASQEDIAKAYKQRCLIFHPDRHIDEDDKKEASKIFLLLRQAYETLSDPHLRSIYDTVGTKGLQMQGWQLMQRSSNPENIRREYEFLKKLRENEIMLQRIHPASNFVVKATLTGLFPEAPEERYAPQIVGLTLSQSVDCAMTSTDKVGLAGRVRSTNGRGDGSITASWKKSVSPTLHLENSLSVSPDAIETSLKLSKTLGSAAVFLVQPSLSYLILKEHYNPSIMLLYTMQLRLNWQGTIALNYSPFNQSSLTTSIVKMELEQIKYLANLTLSPVNSNVRFVHNVRYSQNDAHYETACSIGFFGISPSFAFERRLSRYSKISASISFTYPMCLLQTKFKLKTNLNNYEVQFVLCDNKDDFARSTIFGVMIPFVAVKLLRLALRKPIAKFMRLFEDQSEAEQVNESKKEEAQKIVHLMRNTAEKIAREEEMKHGLVIVEAQYGQMSNDMPGAELYPVAGEQVIDVTIPLQTLVNDSQLRIYSNKDQLPGFYDPCPGEAKILKVIYKFRDELHAVTVNDDQALNIPLRAHIISA